MVTGDSNSGVISVLIVAKCNVNIIENLTIADYKKY